MFFFCRKNSSCVCNESKSGKPTGPSGGAANNRRGSRRQTGSLPTPHRGHSLSLVLPGNTLLNFKGEQNSITIRMERKERNVCNNTQTQVPLYKSLLNHQRSTSNFWGEELADTPKRGSELASSTSGQTSTLGSCYGDREGKSIKCCSYQNSWPKSHQGNVKQATQEGLRSSKTQGKAGASLQLTR